MEGERQIRGVLRMRGQRLRLGQVVSVRRCRQEADPGSELGEEGTNLGLRPASELPPKSGGGQHPFCLIQTIFRGPEDEPLIEQQLPGCR